MANLKDVVKTENPLTSNKNMLAPKNFLGGMLWVVSGLAIFGAGEFIWRKMTGRVGQLNMIAPVNPIPSPAAPKPTDDFVAI